MRVTCNKLEIRIITNAIDITIPWNLREINKTLQLEVIERKYAEEALKKNQVLLTSAEQISNIGSWECDIKKDECAFSDNWLRIHGCAFTTKIPRKQLMALVHPDDVETLKEVGQRLRGK